MTDFVNPYTFVPLVRDVVRSEPAGHAVMGDGRLSGVLEVTLTARTPLLIGGFEQAGAGGKAGPDVPRRADGTAIIPGSGLLGAIRSVHEALAGGCLRVLDTDRVAVHRHPASTEETKRLDLAIVLEVDGQGRAVSVGRCDEVIWVDQTLLPRGQGLLPKTGDRLRLPAGKAVDAQGRKLLRPGKVSPDEVTRVAGMNAHLAESWVLLVTDTHARKSGQPVYFAAGRAGPGVQRYPVTDGAWEQYLNVVSGADDLRPARLPGNAEPRWPAEPEFGDVCWPPGTDGAGAGPVIARRLPARSYVYPGQPVWVENDGGKVTEVRLSQLWRYQGRYPAGERAGGAVPCDDAGFLCWSCRVFGSADTSGRDEDDIARQRSYRGHVRFDDMEATEGFEPVPWPLAPRAAPRPSAGQFYLDHTDVPARGRRAAKDTRPAATWGSVADQPGPRPLRGRKFYWRTAGPEQGAHPRGRRRHQGDTITRDVVLIPAGTRFTGRVCFENLGAADYGSLLAALDPRLLAGAAPEEWAGAVTSVGGGKPFGFGAVSIDVVPVCVQTAAGRYLGAGDAVPEPGEAVAAFRAGVPWQVAATWAALRNVLHLGFIGNDLVWYPPGLRGRKGDAEFDRSFEFFGRSNGLELKDKVRDLVLLPRPDSSAASQVLDSAGGEHATDVPAADGRAGGVRAGGSPRGGRAAKGGRRQ